MSPICLLYVSTANGKLHPIRRNPAETPLMENSGKQAEFVEKRSGIADRRIAVAPMMDWTDKHCRYFLRGFSPHVLLYTEMITSAAILRGDRKRLLAFNTDCLLY